MTFQGLYNKSGWLRRKALLPLKHIYTHIHRYTCTINYFETNEKKCVYEDRKYIEEVQSLSEKKKKIKKGERERKKLYRRY